MIYNQEADHSGELWEKNKKNNNMSKLLNFIKTYWILIILVAVILTIAMQSHPSCDLLVVSC